MCIRKAQEKPPEKLSWAAAAVVCLSVCVCVWESCTCVCLCVCVSVVSFLKCKHTHTHTHRCRCRWPKILGVKVMQAEHIQNCCCACECACVCMCEWCVCVCVWMWTCGYTHMHVLLTYEDSLVSFLARKSNQHTQQARAGAGTESGARYVYATLNEWSFVHNSFQRGMG